MKEPLTRQFTACDPAHPETAKTRGMLSYLVLVPYCWALVSDLLLTQVATKEKEKKNSSSSTLHQKPLVLTEGKGLHPGDGRDGQDLKQRSDNGKLPFHTNYTLTTFNLFNIHLQFTGLKGYIYI